MARPPTAQRTFRLAPETLDRLDERARDLGESRNSLAQRLLDEGLRLEQHPLIYFREGAAGLRRPALVGTRLYVWQVVDTLRASDSVQEAASYLADRGAGAGGRRLLRRLRRRGGGRRGRRAPVRRVRAPASRARATGTRGRLLLDEQYSPDIVAHLRSGGTTSYRFTTLVWRASPTGLCSRPPWERSAPCDNNVRDLAQLAGAWAAEGSVHNGLVLTSDRSLPRARNTIGMFVKALEALLDAEPSAGGLQNQGRWLETGR